MNLTVSIGDRLKEERTRLGMTQPVMGQVGGVTKKSQMLYEASERSPDAKYLAALSAVGVDVLYVLTGSRSNTQSTAHLTPEEQTLLNAYRDGDQEKRRFVLAAALGFTGTPEAKSVPKKQKVRDNHGVMIMAAGNVTTGKR